ncbi:MAG: hypothetical protein LIP01_03810 [Tannerellaceae bacterium]|nr:hypothetical protein [Tannerellaceae bacterium]
MSSEQYIAVYYNVLLIFVLIVAIPPLKAYSVREPYFRNGIWSLFLFIFVMGHITFRPIHYLFGDTPTYAAQFTDKNYSV